MARRKEIRKSEIDACGSSGKRPSTMTVAWWNTSLHPPRAAKMDVGLTGYVYKGLVRLLKRVDLLFLGECFDIAKIEKLVINYNKGDKSKRFSVDWRREASENRKFHTICIFDEMKFEETPDCEVENYLKLTDSLDGKYYRVGQLYDFYSMFFGKVVSFYVAHWSQYSEEDGEAMKILAAHRLRMEMGRTQSKYRICLGDFNCEPYAKAMAVLGASRSGDYVKNRGGFFNPAWALLARQQGSIASENTRFLKTQSPIFDQILIDRNLVLEKGLEFVLELFDSKVYKPRKGEHSPVALTIIRK